MLNRLAHTTTGSPTPEKPGVIQPSTSPSRIPTADEFTFGNVPQHIAAYLDDIVIFSSSWEEHVDHLEEALSRLQGAGLTLRAKKCQIAKRDCLFLGHVVGRGKVRPEEAKITAIRKFLKPKTKKHVRSFLGLTGYYRRFVKDYSTTAAPLTDLTRNSLPDKVRWETHHQEDFDELIRGLTSHPVLRGPDYDSCRNWGSPQPSRHRRSRQPSGLLLQEIISQGGQLCSHVPGNC